MSNRIRGTVNVGCSAVVKNNFLLNRRNNNGAADSPGQIALPKHILFAVPVLFVGRQLIVVDKNIAVLRSVLPLNNAIGTNTDKKLHGQHRTMIKSMAIRFQVEINIKQ